MPSIIGKHAKEPSLGVGLEKNVAARMASVFERMPMIRKAAIRGLERDVDKNASIAEMSMPRKNVKKTVSAVGAGGVMIPGIMNALEGASALGRVNVTMRGFLMKVFPMKVGVPAGMPMAMKKPNGRWRCWD